MNKLTPTQALQNLYNASTLAHLTAAEHLALVDSAKILEALIPKEEVIAPKEEIVTPEEPKE